MSTVQLSDVFEPESFAQLIQQKSDEKNAFKESGVIQEDARLTALASSGGRTAEMPSYAPLENNEPNYSTDDNTSFSTPDKIGSQMQSYRLAIMNKSWSAMNLARELTNSDPVSAIVDSISDYWRFNDQTRLIRSCMGLLADNVANDNSDMLYTTATDDAATITDAEKISGSSIILSSATMGDRQDQFTALAIHGMLYAHLRDTNQIEFVVGSDQKTKFPTWQGMHLVVDDGLPAVAGTNRITYTSILFKSGVFGLGHGKVLKPSTLEFKDSSGDGGGEEVIYSRKSDILHPWGCDFTSASVAGVSPDWSELEAAANWNRVYTRKSIGMAFLQTNG